MKTMHNGSIGPCKRGGEGPLEVMACQETNKFDGSSIQAPVAELCGVASCMKMLFMDTWSLLGPGAKKKWSNKIACRWLRQVCMGNADMGTPPRPAWRRFFQS